MIHLSFKSNVKNNNDLLASGKIRPIMITLFPSFKPPSIDVTGIIYVGDVHTVTICISVLNINDKYLADKIIK